MGAREPLTGAAYLDASAAVKLLVEETESTALATHLTHWPTRVSSELLRIELVCVCQRQGLSTDIATERLAGIRLLPLTAATLREACQPFRPPQRALDAIHLSAAEQARELIGTFITYDSDQAAAALARGWRVEQPAG